jgi:hypothetical protein
VATGRLQIAYVPVVRAQNCLQGRYRASKLTVLTYSALFLDELRRGGLGHPQAIDYVFGFKTPRKNTDKTKQEVSSFLSVFICGQ